MIEPYQTVPFGQHFSDTITPDTMSVHPTSLAIDKEIFYITQYLGMLSQIGQVENWVNIIASDPTAAYGMTNV